MVGVVNATSVAVNGVAEAATAARAATGVTAVVVKAAKAGATVKTATFVARAPTVHLPLKTLRSLTVKPARHATTPATTTAAVARAAKGPHGPMR